MRHRAGPGGGHGHPPGCLLAATTLTAPASLARPGGGGARPPAPAGDLASLRTEATRLRATLDVGMYIGKGLMVEAPHTGAVVRTSSIWRPSYAGAVRPAP
jgi:cell wall-associated NlpC family hydrolase